MNIRRVRTEGRKAAIAASVLALVGLGTGGAFLAVALAAPTKPPAPTITGSPSNPTTASSATFTFADSQSGVTFKCSRDGSAFTMCSSGINYPSLTQGNHAFSVEALAGTLTSAVTTYAWAIVPPTPTILTGPASPTTATTAKFTFSDTQAGVSFKCSRDGANFAACTSGITYAALANGSHTFQVEATSGSATSGAAARSWTVDTEGPTVNITFPANQHTYGTGTWNTGCAGGPTICGAATDATAVASVQVGVLSLNTLRYWNGTTFGSTGPFMLTANGTTSWRLPLPVPPAGTYGVLVAATDTLGNVRQLGQIMLFSINTTPPPTPVITTHPASSTSATGANFAWTDSKAGVTFQCTLDSGTAGPCTSPTPYTNLTATNHCFSVVAVDALGNTSTPASFCWTITSTHVATTIAMLSGSPQDTALNSPIGAPLVAKVTDASNNPVAGISVTFAAPASVASGTFASSGCVTNTPTTSCTVTTNASGIATSSVFTANGTPGGYTVTATASGVGTPANFSLINDTPLAISGNVPDSSTQPFYPGLTQSLNLTVHNPYNFSITVTSISVTVQNGTTYTADGTPNPSCSGTTPVANVIALPYTLTGTVQLLAGQTKTLTAAGATSLPQVQMQDLPHFNQNGCKNTTFHFTYAGSAKQ